MLILQQGMSQAEAARVVGVQRQTVNIWLQRYRARGADGVLDGRRASPRRGNGLLTADESAKVQGWIRDRTPDQLKLPYLRRWNMTPQKPLARARERQPAAIAAWLEQQHYPAIARRTKAEGAAIYWGDETGISNHQAPAAPDPSAELARAFVRAGDQIGRSYAPKGQTSVIARTTKRVTQSMISAVSNRGLMRFMFYEGALNANRFIAFLRRLAKDAGQKVFLIVDNLKVHHAGKVKTWVAAHAHEIELFYLPAIGLCPIRRRDVSGADRAPDHNPDEYLNNDLKQKLRQQPQPATPDELIKNTRAVLRAIQGSPRCIQAYFKPPAVRYAA